MPRTESLILLIATRRPRRVFLRGSGLSFPSAIGFFRSGLFRPVLTAEPTRTNAAEEDGGRKQTVASFDRFGWKGELGRARDIYYIPAAW